MADDNELLFVSHFLACIIATTVEDVSFNFYSRSFT